MVVPLLMAEKSLLKLCKAMTDKSIVLVTQKSSK